MTAWIVGTLLWAASLAAVIAWARTAPTIVPAPIRDEETETRLWEAQKSRTWRDQTTRDQEEET